MTENNYLIIRGPEAHVTALRRRLVSDYPELSHARVVPENTEWFPTVKRAFNGLMSEAKRREINNVLEQLCLKGHDPQAATITYYIHSGMHETISGMFYFNRFDKEAVTLGGNRIDFKRINKIRKGRAEL